MIKKRKVKDNPEYQYFEENYDKIMEDLDNDPELQNLEIPDEWDKNFRKTIEETIEREAQKQNVRDKRFKWIGRGVAAAAGIALVMFIGMNMSAVQVQGEGLLDVFKNTFNLYDKQVTVVDVGDETGENNEEEWVDVYFDADTLEEAYQQIREELKMPMFYVYYVPEGYYLEKAEYNKTYDILNLEITNEKDRIYISQQQQFNEVSTGVLNEENQFSEVENYNLNQNIKVFKSIQDGSLVFSVSINHTMLVVNCNCSIDEIEKIAKSIEFH